MDIQFRTPFNLGVAYSNLIRQVLIEHGEFIKPVAFKCSDGASLYAPSEHLDDLISFVANISSLTYCVSDSLSLPLTVTYSIKKGTFMSEDLNSSSVMVKEKGIPLITKLDDTPIYLTLVLDKGCGYQSSKDNEERLANLNDEGLQFIGSRHYLMEVGKPTIKQDLNGEIVRMKLSSPTGNEEKLFEEAISQIQEVLNKISKT